MTYIPSDDDDLFDYDPEQEETTSAQTNISNPSVNNQKSSDYVHAVKDSLKNTTIDIDSSGVNQAQVRLSSAFYDGTHHWINNDSVVNSFIESVAIVLDEMTNNDYSRIRYFKEIEFKLARKLLVDFLMEEAFNIADSDNYANGIQGIMKEMFDVETSDFYMNITYTSLFNLNKHSITLDRILYQALSEKLGIPVKECLFAEELNVLDLYNVTNYSKSNAEKFNVIMSEIIDKNYIKMAKVDEDTQVYNQSEA